MCHSQNISEKTILGMFTNKYKRFQKDVTDNLEWGQHVAEISSKATKTLGFLRSNLALTPRHTKEVAYQTLVHPQLEYAAPIWHPYNETETKKVEKVQDSSQVGLQAMA